MAVTTILQEKTAIVTGAGSGIGREVSLLLAQKGYQLALVGRNRHKLEETARLAWGERGPDTPGCFVAPLDLCDPRAVRELVLETAKLLGRIDAIANVAGDAPRVPIEEVTPAVWQKCIDTNLSSVVHLVAAAWPILRKQGGGVIVNVSSMASIDPFPGFGIYAASKAGLNMFTHCIAQEGKEANIRAVCVAPGSVETPMLRTHFSTSQIPHEKTLKAQEVAKLICDCITGWRLFKPGEVILMPSP